MKIENINLPHHITVDAATIQKMNYLLDSKYDREFTGFCHGEKRENGEYHISDIFFPRQDNSSVTTECDSEDIIALMKEGFDISRATGHIHSHVDMGVFASSTDKKDILERAKDCGFNAALIMNKKGKIFGHIADMELGIYIEDCPVYIEYPFSNEEFEKVMLEQIKKAKSLEDVGYLLEYTDSDYMDMNFPLSNETKDFLDDVVKTRFHESFTGTTVYTSKSTTVKNQKKTNNVKKVEPEVEVWENQWKDEEDDFYTDLISEEMKSFFHEDDLAIIPGLFDKGVSEMTDKEWMLYDEVTKLFPEYVPGVPF